LRRAGAKVDAAWPPPEHWPRQADVVYWLLGSQDALLLVGAEEVDLAFIAIVEAGVADVERLLNHASPHGVLAKPFHAFAILTSLTAALSVMRYERRLKTKVRKLEETVRSIRKVEQAKAILMQARKLDEQGAYEFLRKRAMDRRVPIGNVAEAIIEASDVLAS
jgi:AmiR/NasT family two-component response regulator